MSKIKAYFADLTHTAQGISAATFPLGVSYVMSYAQQELGRDLDCRLFKFPSDLDRAILEEWPNMLCFSNYSWNFELAYKIASLAKERDPDLVVVFGGPNFPTVHKEKLEFLQSHPSIDFYIELEGEMGFVELARELMDHDLSPQRCKNSMKSILNTCYLSDGEMVSGITKRIPNLDLVPSPYLTGILDAYFDLPLVPMLETTRGCPFSCTFCADGLESKNKVYRYAGDRTREELVYIASRVKDVNELIITDLNFAMYQQDIETAKAVADIQRKYSYPTMVSASAGKNKPQRTIEAASIMVGWTLGASIQSTDPEVLKSIKRSNISSAAYQSLIDYGNSLDNSKTHSEIILGLPGDTKEKHFESLRFGIENNVNHMRMFQAMMLSGTEMANQSTRKEFGLVSKFRTIPGCLGIYSLLGEQHPITEIEEIIVGSDTLSAEDYIDCRIMNLIVETFHNNAMFEEVFSMVRAMGVSPFDCLLYLKAHPELYSSKIKEIIAAFVEETTTDLFDTQEEVKGFVLTPEVIDRYIGGELGTNELLLHRAQLFTEIEDTCHLLIQAVKETLREINLLTDDVDSYLDELESFTVLRKQDPFTNTDAVRFGTFRYDFEDIARSHFRVAPKDLAVSDTPLEFRFYHDGDQQRMIGNQVKIYSDTPMGLGRLIQRSNLKLMFRTFVRTVPVS
jgi:radical SAM superfamily enzyme YgiQ (UPF0313 family)